MKKLILASASPRRKELLSMLNIPFIIETSDVEEVMEQNLQSSEIVMKLAEEKAIDVSNKFPNAVVIGADTIVTYNDKKLGKPTSKEDAFAMLKMLSGKTHEVFTGVSIINEGKSSSFYQCTKITFSELSDQEIMDYINTNEPMDKAGSYGIQGFGGTFVEKIDGDYYSVVGLPINKVKKKLRELNF
ncbi:Maf family protein [Gottfriedia acidiceleris]|uniref:Maf family protein n=1 Tax=Bacillaceae TaxID=186817 RepID=UPI000BEBFFEC|nr:MULTISPECIES: Maf family protein [unclassified Bacillus (in: firmicutes)]PEC47522.1 septum formation inhibitor Maf [Bacillus sp. AFS096315]PFM75839.1 septum formation inhibitor Maf [Bacillus sp. AFS077874]